MKLEEIAGLEPGELRDPARYAAGHLVGGRSQPLYAVAEVEITELPPVPEAAPPDDLRQRWQTAEEALQRIEHKMAAARRDAELRRHQGNPIGAGRADAQAERLAPMVTEARIAEREAAAAALKAWADQEARPRLDDVHQEALVAIDAVIARLRVLRYRLATHGDRMILHDRAANLRREGFEARQEAGRLRAELRRRMEAAAS